MFWRRRKCFHTGLLTAGTDALRRARRRSPTTSAGCKISPPVAGPRGRPRDRGPNPDRDPLLHHEPKDVSRGASEGRPKPLGDREQPALGSGRPNGRGRSAEPGGPRRGKPRGRPANRSEHHPPHGRQAVDPTTVPMGGAKAGISTGAHPPRGRARARTLKCDCPTLTAAFLAF